MSTHMWRLTIGRPEKVLFLVWRDWGCLWAHFTAVHRDSPTIQSLPSNRKGTLSWGPGREREREYVCCLCERECMGGVYVRERGLTQCRYQCQDLNTTYVYDFMELFELAVVKGWQQYGKKMQGTQEQKQNAAEVCVCVCVCGCICVFFYLSFFLSVRVCANVCVQMFCVPFHNSSPLLRCRTSSLPIHSREVRNIPKKSRSPSLNFSKWKRLPPT